MNVLLYNNDKKYLPVFKTQGASCADICARGDYNIYPGERLLIPTGVFPELPAGYEFQVRPRSGLALKYGITVLNTPGTIDSDYRGEINVILINLGKDIFPIRDGDRIAQLAYSPSYRVPFTVTDKLSETKRGSNGFGSSGIK